LRYTCATPPRPPPAPPRGPACPFPPVAGAPRLRLQFAAHRSSPSYGASMSAKSASVVDRRRTMAEKADIHELYEEAVQDVEMEVELLQTTFRQLRGRTAHLFRADFCGTASACCQWVRQGPDFRAIGVDIDPSVLDWGRTNRVGRLPAEDQARVQLLESDVMTAETPPVDVIAALNFSYFIFDTRDRMRAYFKRCFD